MRLRRMTVTATLDWTPMIDITFQLMSFFMFVLNFSDAEQNELIQLPESELAKPGEAVLQYPITLHLTAQGRVIMGAQSDLEIDGLRPYLLREAKMLELRGEPISSATIVVRAHKDVATGKVQELIRECQRNGFERFILRAQELVGM
jgi:biopolymer transport protein ExbD